MSKEIIQDAEEVLVNYTTGKLKDAFVRVTKEMHGQGCGCNSCKVKAVEDVNSWVDFVGGDGYLETEHGQATKYGIDKKGKIFQGKKPTQ